MALFGTILWLNPDMYVVAILALLLSIAALGYQYLQARRFWLHSLGVEDKQTPAEPG
jgi:predicted membrane protein